MAYYAGNSVEENASEFIIRTCMILPKSYVIASDYMHDLVQTKSPAPKDYSIVCGSFAEFYIRPWNTCITDIDFLISWADKLAFSGDFPVFPYDMSGLSDAIAFYEIEPHDEYPGFVRLRVLGDMYYNWKNKIYEFSQSHFPCSYFWIDRSKTIAESDTSFMDRLIPSMNRNTAQRTLCGPAIKFETSSEFYYGNDCVQSLFCPQWPREAKDWPLRIRKYSWPTADTIAEVVQNGCHVVYVQHRSCKNDETQWRLSFSVAEVILLQSWTQTQQIVYHLLRFFAKRVLIQKDCLKEDQVICPYHLKSLMLWTCEEMSPEWWNSSSVIEICCELLKYLLESLNMKYCPNYFIPEANLFHEPSRSTLLCETTRQLNQFTSSGILSNWFVENYILPITQTGLTFLKAWSVLPNFMDYLLPLLEYRRAMETHSVDFMLSFRFSDSNKVCCGIIKYGLSTGLLQNFKLRNRACFDAKKHSKMSFLPLSKKVSCFKHYTVLLYILHLACGLRFGEISWDSGLYVEFISSISMRAKIVRSKYHNFPKTYLESSCKFQLLRAQGLMENLTGSNNCAEFQLFSFMSKLFLEHSLKYDESFSSGIAPISFTYLAALHFVTSEYQETMRFCKKVLVNNAARNSTETLNCCCLLFIDDVARIVGFLVLHKKIRNSQPYYINRRLYLDLRLSPKVFAHYLAMLSSERISANSNCYPGLPRSEYPADEYFKAILYAKCSASSRSSNNLKATRQYRNYKTFSSAETDSVTLNPLIIRERVIDGLMEFALEQLTLFYNVIRNDFGIHCNTADCYRALYLYQRCRYNEVQDICDHILNEPDLRGDLRATYVSLIPPLDSFFDNDVQSLLGFHTLFYYLSPLNDDLKKLEYRINSTFEHWFAFDVYFQKHELSASIIRPNPIRCSYFLGRHFLARYLKVRCCNDGSQSHGKALAEFAGQKTEFQFEHIIRRFVFLQKTLFN